jgi:endoglucanase
MTDRALLVVLAGFGLAVVAVMGGCGGDESSGSGSGGVDDPSALGRTSAALAASGRLFIPSPEPGAVKQVASLIRGRHVKDALLVSALEATPRAVWFTGGTPADVERAVHKTMEAAACEHAVPTLVAYNIPYRDCAQYSAGGAVDTAAYEAWIDGFAKGIGDGKAIVILEPDGLGLIPYNTTIYGVTESCKPTVTAADGTAVPAPGANPSERYAQLQFAGGALATKAPHAAVYFDGTHGAWLGVGEAAYRINRASHDPATGAALGKGFFLDASNYRLTAEAIQFGTWVSMCTAFATDAEEGGWRLGNFSWCASQYNPATGFALDYTPEYAASVTAQLQGLMGTSVATLSFVIDTSRNGQGPWTPAATYPDAQDWCNPPGRGLGLRPTISTGTALADAYLWIKTPGDSDGSCNRGVAGATTDPEWAGITDPAAGAWFPQQALQLAQLANPPLF